MSTFNSDVATGASLVFSPGQDPTWEPRDEPVHASKKPTDSYSVDTQYQDVLAGGLFRCTLQICVGEWAAAAAAVLSIYVQ